MYGFILGTYKIGDSGWLRNLEMLLFQKDVYKFETFMEVFPRWCLKAPYLQSFRGFFAGLRAQALHLKSPTTSS